MNTDPRTALLGRLLATLDVLEQGNQENASRDLKETLVRRTGADLTLAWLQLASEATGANAPHETVTQARAAMAARGVPQSPLMQRVLDGANLAVQSASRQLKPISENRSRLLFTLATAQFGAILAAIADHFRDNPVTERGSQGHRSAQELAAQLLALVNAEGRI